MNVLKFLPSPITNKTVHRGSINMKKKKKKMMMMMTWFTWKDKWGLLEMENRRPLNEGYSTQSDSLSNVETQPKNN